MCSSPEVVRLRVDENNLVILMLFISLLEGQYTYT